MSNDKIRKVGEGAYFAIDTLSFTSSLITYDPLSATQNITYGWEPVPQTEPTETPITEQKPEA